ncbi:MAG TPA: tripartite tricarboxylate transporter substrate binding protein [Reyranella sp.]|nr:tripartite tricarboxylate transporter substrate binding protein [Reyranella sp.]
MKFLLVAIAALVAGTIQAPAQEWPSKPLHFIVPFAAGGSTDVLTRLLCEQLTIELKTPCVVENKGGAGGNLGGAAVAAAPADGYTFLVSAPGVLAYNKILYREMAFDPDKDLDPICLYAFQPNVLVVNPALPVKSVAELIAYAKAHPHQLNYASGGVGSTSHVAGELFKTMAGLEWQHVPYRGTGPSLVDLLAGQVQFTIDNLPAILPHIKSGALRALAISTDKRVPQLPACRPSPRQACRVTPPSPGKWWRRPAARPARSSTAWPAPSASSLPIPPFARGWPRLAPRRRAARSTKRAPS